MATPDLTQPTEEQQTIASVFALDEPSEAQAPGAGADVVAPSPAPDPLVPPVVPATPTPPAPSSPADAAPASATPASVPPVAPAPSSAEVPPAAVPPASPSPEVLERNAAQATIQALQQQIAHLTAQPPAGGPGAAAPPATTTGTDGAALIEYALSVPPELGQAIFGEDPAIAMQGLQVLVNSLATVIHTRVNASFQQTLQRRDAEMQQSQMHVQRQQAAEQMQQDYYGAFPAHNNPVVKQIVAQQAGQLQVEYPNLPWNADYVNALGARVNQAIAALTGQPAADPAAPTPTPPAPPPPKPAGFAPAGTRGAIPNGEGSELDLIASTFALDD